MKKLFENASKVIVDNSWYIETVKYKFLNNLYNENCCAVYFFFLLIIKAKYQINIHLINFIFRMKMNKRIQYTIIRKILWMKTIINI